MRVKLEDKRKFKCNHHRPHSATVRGYYWSTIILFAALPDGYIPALLTKTTTREGIILNAQLIE